MISNKVRMGIAVILGAVLGVAAWTWAQSKPSGQLPLPGYAVASDVPNAHEMPDPAMTYKVVFDIGKAAPKPDAINPGLVTVARYLNTLGKYGVPADHRKIAVVFHLEGTPIIQNNDAYKASHNGQDNPNVAIIRDLKKAGVDFRVCGQAVLANKIDQKNIMPEIQVDLWALTTIITLENKGYAHIGGN